MPSIGPMEIVVVLVIALVVLGPKRLPELARSAGKGMREFKDAMSMEEDDEDDREEGRRSRDRERLESGTGT